MNLDRLWEGGGESPDMVDEILEHIHHVRRDIVEGDGRITAACSSIGLRDETLRNFRYKLCSHLKAKSRRILTSGETLCRDNCQLIGMPFFILARQAKNNRN